ncbi:hypothetical protein [Streptomyces sp. NPDC017940]|uniref:hypothetical protein n=1 Tax=Streptomyces sp. NPDC017940 TaxID=3365017 RepID=UPI0037986CBE
MQISRGTAAALYLGTALVLTACGQERADQTVPGSAQSHEADRSPTPTRSPLGPKGNVESDVHDGAPHYRENNKFKASKEMSAADEQAARKEAARIEPVIKRLWKNKVWDPGRVRAALVKLGYRAEGPGGDSGDGSLSVYAIDSYFETDHYVTPEGAKVALRVGEDACVTAFTQPTNYQVSVNGLFLEGGCFMPKGGH